MTTDLLTTLAAIRPQDPFDDVMSREAAVAMRDRVIATPASTPARRPVATRRRVVTVAAAGAVFSVAGLTAAGAAGLFTWDFDDSFSYWQTTPIEGRQGISPEAAERVATAPGPDGMMFSVVIARGEDGYRCVTAIVETLADSRLSAPSEYVASNGSECRVGVNTQPFGVGGTSTMESLGWVYSVSAGSAVRAEVSTATGPGVPPVLVEGQFYGWFPTPPDGDPYPWPVITGYAEDGTVVGEMVL